MADKVLLNALDIAIEALGVCEAIHERTGATKIPLDDVANEMGKGTTKKQIQEGFWVLVEMGVIGDDNDDQNMNYTDGNELTELLKQIRIEELNKENETPHIAYLNFKV